MILTVTLNAALDVTYRLEAVARHEMNRVEAVASRAGGKGINVARVLRLLGEDAAVTGLCGGPTGEVIRRDLEAAALTDHLHPIAAESRRTLALVERSGATLLNEPGPEVTPGEWEAFLERYRGLLGLSSAVVLSGSLPRGLPGDAYAVLAAIAGDGGRPVVLDADGEALRAGLRGRPRMVKPNADELARLFGETSSTDPVAGLRGLCAAGAETAVVSLGERGLVALAREGAWTARPPRVMRGNATGAGDAAVAALTLGLVRGLPWPERLAQAVAVSAAAVLAPVAGEADMRVYRELLPLVRVEQA
ncbi:MAG TPA: 1-phosphofructokinase family hexose kinase [Candidatus Dormibacteraeota bacterium]|nr:1-phosphofructokinase family hexose kinase [Candidatus Dormibacteraeota bacterium]